MLNLFRPYHRRKFYHGDYFCASELTEETFVMLKEKMVANKIELGFGLGTNNSSSLEKLIDHGATQFVVSYTGYTNKLGGNYIFYNTYGGTRKIDVNRYLYGD